MIDNVSMRNTSSRRRFMETVVAAAAAIHVGLAHTILCVFGGTRDPAVGGFGPGVVWGMPPASKGSAFEAPFGPTPGANTGYALMKRRHINEFGTTQEPFAKMAVHQRFNALINLNAVFQGSLSLSKTSSLHAWSMIPCTGWNVSCPPGVRLRASSPRQSGLSHGRTLPCLRWGLGRASATTTPSGRARA